jgi:hypothetical protein
VLPGAGMVSELNGNTATLMRAALGALRMTLRSRLS